MEDWKLDFEWLRIRHIVKDRFGRDQLPDVNGILFLIGLQELGQVQESFTKEEKQDLMHIAVCRLLEPDGFYRFVGFDQDGWPHYEEARPFRHSGVKQQEELLKEKIIDYFRHMERQTGAFEENP